MITTHIKALKRFRIFSPSVSFVRVTLERSCECHSSAELILTLINAARNSMEGPGPDLVNPGIKSSAQIVNEKFQQGEEEEKDEIRELMKTRQRQHSEVGKPPPPTGLGTRHVQAVLMFLCTSVAYSLRVNLSVAIVAMTDRSAGGHPSYPVYENWDKVQSVLLSSFFWGYLVMQVPASQFAQRFGAKFFLGGAMIGTGLFSLVLPLAAMYGDWPAVAASRVASGLCQGFVFPSCYFLLGKWAPPLERGRLTAFVIGAQLMGPVIALPVTGVLASSAGGWPSVFYVFGSLGILVGILVLAFVADSPDTHPRISEEEKKYIVLSIGSPGRANLNAVRTPWKAILTSVPLWATISAHCGQTWGFLTFLTEVPTYMSAVLRYDIKSNGVLSALPYFTTWIMSFVFSWISDFTTERQLLSVTKSRKIFNTIGMWGPGLTLICVGYVHNSPILAVVLLTLALGFKAGTYVGFQVNYVDLAPQFSGTSFGIGNFLSISLGTLAPITVGLIVSKKDSQEQWRYVFFLTSALFFLGNLIFILFGSAKVQPWNGSRKASLYLSKDSIACQDIERLRAASLASAT